MSNVRPDPSPPTPVPHRVAYSHHFYKLETNSNKLDSEQSDQQYDKGTVQETVREGRYFLVGDNVLRSQDSRSFGAISKTAIIGKVSFVLWLP